MQTRTHPGLLISAGVVLTLLFVPSCSDGGGGFASGIALTGASIGSSSNVVPIGHPVTIEVWVLAEERAFDVPIGFDLLRRDDVDSEAPEVLQYHIASRVITSVEEGENQVLLEVHVPATIDQGEPGGVVALLPGEYYLACILDPLEQRGERDTSDNAMISAVVIDLVATPLPDLRADHLERNIDDVVVLHDGGRADPLGTPGNTSNALSHLGAILTAQTFGPAPVQGVSVTAYVDLTGSANAPGPSLEPLLIWDSVLESYVATYMIPELRPGESLSLHLDLHMPPATRALVSRRIASHADFEYDLVVIIDEADLIAEMEPEGASTPTGSAPNNSKRVGFLAIQPDPTPLVDSDSVEYPAGYRKGFFDKHKYFGIDVDLESKAAFDGTGAQFDFSKETDLTVFGAAIPFFGLGVGGRHAPHREEDSLFSLELKLGGSTIWAPGGGVGFGYSQGPTPWTWHVERHRTFNAGPFPITVTGELLAGLEIGLQAHLDDDFSVGLVPKLVGLQATLEGGFGFPGAQAGVGGSLTLCEFSFVSSVGCEMSLNGLLDLLSGQLVYELSYELEGPSGEIFLFAEWGTPKWCFFLPCGLKKHKVKIGLARWGLSVFEGTLLQETAPILVVPIL